MIYLDNSATTYPKPKELYEALDFANRNLAFNAGRGNYKESSDAIKMIDETREKIKSLVDTKDVGVVFTASATESLNLIIYGLDIQEGDCIYISPFEHNAIVRPLYNLQKKIDFEILMLPFDKKTWMPEVDKISAMFSLKRPRAVLISHVSNVVGLELDYESIFKLAKEFGGTTVLDSAQSFGVNNPRMKYVDLCVFAGHKSLYASFGVAGFLIKNGLNLVVEKSGGTGSDSLNHDMPAKGHQRYEAGSLNSVAIYGLNKSIDWLKTVNIKQIDKELSTRFIEEVKNIDKIILYLPSSQETLGIISLNVSGYISDDVASILYDEFKIMVRSGYHCSPFVHKFIGSAEYKGTVRISFGAFNTKEDVDAVVSALKTL